MKAKLMFFEFVLNKTILKVFKFKRKILTNKYYLVSSKHFYIYNKNFNKEKYMAYNKWVWV